MPTSPMVTSSPGYAIFNDLRRSMGTSSSQPMPTPSREANTFTMASPSPESGPQPSPNMDDVAASQQLIDEGARANPTLSANQKLSQVVGAHDKPPSAQKKRKRHKAKATQKSSQTFAIHPSAAILDEAPTSSPFPFPATQPEAEEITRTPSGHLRVLPVSSETSHAVEVPDSQIAAAPMGAPTSPPRSSYVIPSSATKSKKTYKRSRQAKRDKIVQDVLMGDTVNEPANTNAGTQDLASPSPSHATAPLKRQRVGDMDTGFSHAAVDVTPVAAKRRKIGTPKSATTVQDLIETGSNDDEYPQQASKAKLKRVKKPHTPVTTPKNIYDIPDDESDLANGISEGPPSSAVNGPMYSGNGGESDDLQKTPALQKRSTEKKKRKSGDNAYHWPASVRKPSQSLNGTSTKAPYNGELMDDPISSDDGDSLHPPPEDPPADDGSEKKVQKKKKTKQNKEKTTPHKGARSKDGGVNGHRRSIGRSVNQASSAERALNTVRDLGHPPDLRTSGEFTEDEEELIRRAIKDYQQRKGLEISELVEIIQWNQYDPRFHREPGVNRSKSEWTPQDREDMQESTEFWDEIKSIGLRRSHERLRRHIRQLYHQFKTGAWTEEDDEQLRNLQAAYPNQWKLISISMGDRSMFDCVNRWRDYLQYGDDRKTSRWTKDEEDLLTRAVTTVAQRDEDHRAETGRPPLDVYTNKDISWPQVAREMGNSRSRIQASVKWSRMMKRNNPPQIEIEYKPRTSAAALSKTSTPGKRGRPQKKDALQKSGDQGSPRRYMSQPDAESSDEEKETKESEKQIQDGTEPGTGLAGSKKHRRADSSDDEAQNQAHANTESTNSPLAKKKRERTRKSEGAGPSKPQKRRKSSPARGGSEIRETEEEQGKDERSGSSARNNKELEKERAEESENEQVSESEERQPSMGDADESSEKDANDALLSEVGEADEQKAGEEEQSDEASESSDTTSDSRYGATEAENQSAVESEVEPATAPPEEHQTREGSAEPGVDQMLWGDKYDLIFKLQDRRDDYEEDIDWEDVRKDQAYPWSVETLKAALGQLIKHLRDTGREVDADDFPGTIDDVMDVISEEHAAELEEHYSRS